MIVAEMVKPIGRWLAILWHMLARTAKRSARKAGKVFTAHRWTAVAFPIVGLVLAMVLTSCTSSTSSSKSDSTPSPSPSALVTKATPSAAKATSSAPKKVDTSVVEGVVRKILRAASFKDSDVRIGKVKKDLTAPGSDVFSGPLTSGDDVVKFLSSGTSQAKAALSEATKQTGATTAELQNPDNWVPVQFTGTSVRWGGNTYYTGKLVKAQTAKVDPAGTTALIFVPPQQIAKGKVTSVYVLRGACGNPQTSFPVPAPPTPQKVVPPAHYVPPPAPPTTRPCVQPWYAGYKGYREVSPCVWIKDLPTNTWNCQQVWHSGCPGDGGRVQPPQTQTSAQSSATSRATATSTVPTTAPTSAPTTTSVVTGTPVIGSTATPTTNPTSCPFGQTSC